MKKDPELYIENQITKKKQFYFYLTNPDENKKMGWECKERVRSYLSTLLSTEDDGGVTSNNTYAYISSFVP
jgi:hypothetical protein